MHKLGVCHRDIKPANIYLSRSMDKIKILDFNCAKEVTLGTTTFGIDGDQKYQAPEMRAGHNYDHKIDVWGASLVSYEILTNGQAL